MPEIRDLMELASLGVEILAVVIMVFFIIIGTMRWVVQSTRKLGDDPVKNVRIAYEGYRLMLGKSMLVGLELLVAADIIRTVALDLTMINIELLGALVVVRTFLGWSIVVELEGRWPWQKKKESGLSTGVEAAEGTAP
jgi:uncharacterized membrane protein